jgi:WD40 repeat protein
MFLGRDHAMARATNLLFLVMLAVIAAACGGGGNAKTESTSTPAETPTPAETATPPPATWTPAPSVTWEPFPTYEVTARPTATQFVPPTLTAVFVPTTITVDNAGQLAEVGSVARGTVADLAWSPDGSTLAVAAADGIELYNDANFISLPRRFVAENEGPGHQPECVAFNPDGTTLAAGYEDGTLRLWDVTGNTVRTSWTVGDGVTIHDCAYTSDGAQLVTVGSQHLLSAWDSSSGELISAKASVNAELDNVAIYPLNAPVVVAGGSDPKPEVWNLDQDTPLATPEGHISNARAVAFSPDGGTFASGGGAGHVYLWTVAGAQRSQPQSALDGPEEQVYTLAYSPDSALLAAGYQDGTLVVWNIQTSAQLFTTQAHAPGVDKAIWAPDGTRLITAGSDAVRVWGVRGG